MTDMLTTAQTIAANLPEGWTATASTYDGYAELTNGTLTIELFSGHANEPRGHAELKGEANGMRWNESAPRIGLSWERSAKALAGDITRRLLTPENIANVDRWAAASRQIRVNRMASRDMARRAMEWPGATDAEKDRGDGTPTAVNGRIPNYGGGGSIFTTSGQWRAEIPYGGEKVRELTLRHLSEEDARAVLEFLEQRHAM